MFVFFFLEQPLCTRGQYVPQDDHSRSLDVTFTGSSPAVIHKTLQIKLICVLCTKEGLSFQHFLHRKPASFLFSGLCGGLAASSEPLLGPIPSGLMHLKRNKGLGGPQTPFSPLLTRTTPSFITPHLPLKLSRTKH